MSINSLRDICVVKYASRLKLNSEWLIGYSCSVRRKRNTNVNRELLGNQSGRSLTSTLYALNCYQLNINVEQKLNNNTLKSFLIMNNTWALLWSFKFKHHFLIHLGYWQEQIIQIKHWAERHSTTPVSPAKKLRWKVFRRHSLEISSTIKKHQYLFLT